MLNLPSDFKDFFYCPDETDKPKRFGNIEVTLTKPPLVETDELWNQSPFEEEWHGFKIRELEIKQNDASTRSPIFNISTGGIWKRATKAVLQL